MSYSSVWADFNEDGSGVYTSDGAYLMTRKTSDNLMWFGFFNDPARSDGPLCIMKDAGQALCSWSENYALLNKTSLNTDGKEILF